MSNRKAIFFSSDHHFFHKNVINFSNRPFKDVDHMHESLIRRHNSVVPESGVCYFLGDFGMGPSDRMKEVLSRLNGTKVLVLGNHCGGCNSMYNIGFDVVVHGLRMQIAGQTVTLSHCPLLGLYREDTSGMRGHDGTENWHGETNPKRRPFTFESKGQFHLHGHIHSPNGGKSVKSLGRQYDVGVDANNYTPVSISKIESWIVKTLREEKD